MTNQCVKYFEYIKMLNVYFDSRLLFIMEYFSLSTSTFT